MSGGGTRSESLHAIRRPMQPERGGTASRTSAGGVERLGGPGLRGVVVKLLVKFVVGIVAVGGYGAARGADWTHWRGPERSGRIAERSGWSEGRWVGEAPSWSADVGEGASSPLVVGARLYAFGARNGRDELTCLDVATGEPLWSRSVAAPRYGRVATGDEGLYSGPSSTPEYDAETGWLYTLGADGDLRAWDLRRDGVELWKLNLYDAYRTPQRPKVGRSGRRDYGYTSAPYVHGSWLLVEVGAPTGTIVAFDKRTGREAWRSEAVGFAGHTGGLAPIRVGGRTCAAALTFDGLLVVELDGDRPGRTVATYPWVTDFANNIATPAVEGDSLLITSEYNHGRICKLQISEGAARRVWEQPYPSKACSPVVHRGRVYLAWQRLRCLDWESGRLIWEGPPVGDAGSCVVTADEKLIVWAGRGDLLLVDIAGANTEYHELARRRRVSTDDVWPHVVVADGRIYCRDRLGGLHQFRRD